jgi:hypothetical protein
MLKCTCSANEELHLVSKVGHKWFLISTASVVALLQQGCKFWNIDSQLLGIFDNKTGISPDHLTSRALKRTHHNSVFQHPVAICIIRQIPRSDPKFHHVLIFDGVGMSINALLIIFISGCVVRIGLFIILFVVKVLLATIYFLSKQY